MAMLWVLMGVDHMGSDHLCVIIIWVLIIIWVVIIIWVLITWVVIIWV